MWTRAELKEKAKIAFKRNYWICVLAALILGLLTGGSNSSSNSNYNNNENSYDSTQTIFLGGMVNPSDYLHQEDMHGSNEHFFNETTVENINPFSNMFIQNAISMMAPIILVVLIVSIILGIFVFSIFEIGGCGFFTKNVNEKADLGEILSGFSGGAYMRNVSTMFFRNLYTFLWTLLLIVPGIVKAYEYRMIPYILAENPNISRQEAFALSKKMMDGEKWNTFVLDLSFIGWNLLSAITFGIVGLFYVNPYMYATKAELYLKLKPYNHNGYSDFYDNSNPYGNSETNNNVEFL